jgi:3-oxoacyl-[acyl-carrier protein] reductase
MAKLAGKISAVTGAAQGIGREIALLFAGEGADIAIAAAKAGVIGFTRSLAYEVAEHGITANAIAPGPIDTELFRKLPEEWRKRKLAELPIGRAGRVEEIAPTALLLASDEGAYYLGATLNPNGGDVMV